MRPLNWEVNWPARKQIEMQQTSIETHVWQPISYKIMWATHSTLVSKLTQPPKVSNTMTSLTQRRRRIEDRAVSLAWLVNIISKSSRCLSSKMKCPRLHRLDTTRISRHDLKLSLRRIADWMLENLRQRAHTLSLRSRLTSSVLPSRKKDRIVSISSRKIVIILSRFLVWISWTNALRADSARASKGKSSWASKRRKVRCNLSGTWSQTCRRTRPSSSRLSWRV